jgi:hypothetical protein
MRSFGFPFVNNVSCVIARTGKSSMYEEKLNLYTGCYRIQNLLSLCLKEQTAYGCLIREAALEWLVP